MDWKEILKSPLLFAMYILNYKPFRYQAEFLEDDGDRIIVVAGRQVGKTTMLAMKVIWEAFVKPKQTILVLAPTFRQSRIVFDRIREMIESSEFLKKYLVKMTMIEIRFKNGSVIHCLSAGRTGECYLPDTEVMVKDGWKRIDEVKDDDLVAQYDPDNNKIEFVKPEKIVSFNYNDYIVSGKNKEIDLGVTIGHRQLYKTSREMKGWKVRNWEEFIDSKGNYYFPKAGIVDGNSPDKFVFRGVKGRRCGRCKEDLVVDFEDYVKFMGIWIAEGFASKVKRKGRKDSYYYLVGISQIRSSKWRKDIEELLDKMNIHYQSKDDRLLITDIRLYEYLKQFGKARDKFIPDEIKNAKLEHRLLFVEWFAKGDGKIRDGKIKELHTYSKRLADDLQYILTISNVSVNISIYDDNGANHYVLYPRWKKDYGTFIGTDFKFERYNGKVYDLVVPSHWLFARRNGKVYVSSNTIRGYSSDLIVIDEAAFVPDEVFVAIEPSLAARQGKLILSGTPFGQRGYFWEIWKRSLNRKSKWHKYKISAKDSPLIDDEFLKEMKDTMSRVEYLQEFEAEFIASAGMFFDMGKVMDCASDYSYVIPKKKKDGRIWVMGVDIARLGTDETVYMLVEVKEDDDGDIDKAKVLWLETEEKSNLVNVAGKIIAYANEYDIDYVVVDETTLGSAVKDMLDESLDNVIGIVFSQKEKGEMYKNLRTLIEQKRLILNRGDDKFLYQFMNIGYEYSVNGMLKIVADGHDDYIDALALALRYNKENTKIGVFEEIVEWMDRGL